MFTFFPCESRKICIPLLEYECSRCLCDLNMLLTHRTRNTIVQDTCFEKTKTL